MFLNEPVFQENKFCNFKTHLFSILNTKQTNDGIFSNKVGENFNLANKLIKLMMNILKAVAYKNWLMCNIALIRMTDKSSQEGAVFGS